MPNIAYPPARLNPQVRSGSTTTAAFSGGCTGPPILDAWKRACRVLNPAGSGRSRRGGRRQELDSDKGERASMHTDARAFELG